MGISKLSIETEDRSPDRRPTRRWVLRALGVSGVAATAAGISLTDALAGKGKKNNKNNKKKKQRCPGGLVRCHAVCAEAGLVCCPASSDGLLGVCPPSHPHCCPLSLYGGCCPPAYPVCCAEECCAPGETCGSDGYCRSS
jgi:hypothetical protein